MSFACCHISFTVLNTFKGKTSDVVIFEQITDPFRPFFYVLQKLLFLSSIMQITLARKWKAHEYNGSVFLQIAYRLKTEALFVLSIWSISWGKSNRSKRDEHWSLTFPIINRVKIFPFSSLVIKVWRAKPKYSHLVFLAFLASIMQITLARKWKVHEDKESIVTHR